MGFDGNYLCKWGQLEWKKFYFKENDNKYLKNPLVSFSVIVPPGGPYYKIETNEAKKNQVLMNPECVDILDELPLL